MVVINTKKIFITFIVSALLLVGSALTVFAFDFSPPSYDYDEPNLGDLEYQLFDLYNFVYNSNTDTRTYFYVGSFRRYYDYSNDSYNDNKFTLIISKYGFDFLSQNGANAQSMKNVLDDFVFGDVGNLRCVYTVGSIYNEDVDILPSFDSTFQSVYDNVEWFSVVDDLNNQFFNYENQYNHLLNSYDLLLTSYTNLNNNYQTLQTNYTNLQSDYNYINNEFELLTNSYNELDTQYRELATQYSYYKNAYENSLIDIESLESTVSNMETVISQLETIVSQLETELETSYMSGYTAAIEEINAFESGIYTIFSSPFVLVGELSQIEIFGTSITKIVGIILLFVILSVVLAFLWKVIPFV